jgi:hypothetical protein
MPVWLVTFFTTHLWKILSVIADVLLIAYVCYSVWLQLHPKPTTTQNQKANQIYNYTLYPDTTGFILGKVGGFELLSYHSNPTSAQIKKVVVIPSSVMDAVNSVVKK